MLTREQIKARRASIPRWEDMGVGEAMELCDLALTAIAPAGIPEEARSWEDESLLRVVSFEDYDALRTALAAALRENERLKRELAEAREKAMEEAATLVENRGKEYVEKWAEMELDEHAKVYGWDSRQHAIAIRALAAPGKDGHE